MQDIRWKQRLNNFEKAFDFSKKSVQLGSYDQLQAAGLVQTFEFNFELAWKTLKDYQNLMGLALNYPREVIKEAFKAGLITDGRLGSQCLIIVMNLHMDSNGRQSSLSEQFNLSVKVIFLR